MNRKDEINSRGFGPGSWYAGQLAKKAARLGRPMSEIFRDTIRTCTAFNVPAECVKVSRYWIFYRFADGSLDKFPNNRG